MDFCFKIAEEESGVGRIPEDGHALLLVETSDGNKTYSDYENIVHCIDNITTLFEKWMESRDESFAGYTIDKLFQWIESHRKFTVFVLDKKILRYKQLSTQELKQEFVEQINKLESQATFNGDSSANPNDHDDLDDDEDRFEY